jgi:hypothetical protein
VLVAIILVADVTVEESICYDGYWLAAFFAFHLFVGLGVFEWLDYKWFHLVAFVAET